MQSPCTSGPARPVSLFETILALSRAVALRLKFFRSVEVNDCAKKPIVIRRVGGIRVTVSCLLYIGKGLIVLRYSGYLLNKGERVMSK